MVKDLITIEVERALKSDGCPMCAFVQTSVKRYLRFLLHEYVNDPGVREELSRSKGFCGEHAWLLQKVESAKWHDGMGTALLHEQILGELLAELDGVATKMASNSTRSNPTWRARWRATLKWFSGLAWPARRKAQKARGFGVGGLCPVCRIRVQSEDIFAFGLLQNLSSTEFRERYQASEGLCVPHLAQVLSNSGSEEIPTGEEETSGDVLDVLLDMERGKIAGLLDELREYVRKHDYRFAHEPKGNEQTSWIRAVRKAVGNESTD